MLKHCKRILIISGTVCVWVVVTAVLIAGKVREVPKEPAANQVQYRTVLKAPIAIRQ
jgi:uncharacterized membrane protein